VKANNQGTRRREIAWEKGIAALKQFQARENHCRVPRGHHEGNFKLGIWVNNQRYRRYNLSVERKQRLDVIKFVWVPYDSAWERGFEALKKFKAREKHCRVPSRYYEDDFRLGSWITNLRNKKDDLSVDFKRRLDAINFIWNPSDIAWAQSFAALKQFKAREGHCRVPRGHEEGKVKLGTWVTNQRNRRNTMSIGRKQRLNKIGFDWRLR
jgi:hypothetical protein